MTLYLTWKKKREYIMFDKEFTLFQLLNIPFTPEFKDTVEFLTKSDTTICATVYDCNGRFTISKKQDNQ
jgi:hypothetical protein